MSRYYEELEPGLVFRHSVTRTVTEVDNLFYVCLAHNDQPIHLDEEFGKKTFHGSRIVASLYVLAFVNGVAVPALTQGTTLGNLGYDQILLPHPVRIGDTLRSESEIISRRESAKHPNAGIVVFEHRGFNQREELVVSARQAGLMLKKAHAIGGA